MHIADGILPTGACLAAQAVSLGVVARLGRAVETAEAPRLGLMSAMTFVVSLIHFPLAGTSIHLGLFGLTGILLGRRAFPVIFATLLFQALLFQHGGLLTLGVNAINMGLGGLIGAIIWRTPLAPHSARAFAAGFAGIMIPALLMAAEFSLSGYGKGFLYLTGIYAITGAIEGALTVTITAFLQKVKPKLLWRAA
ncbi:MAG: energy-coupling factor ABC transporter permease [Phycisphaerales bacterium]|nr:energy-coupling factor ABC transporter permease [Phycisphaerales bacterium]